MSFNVIVCKEVVCTSAIGLESAGGAMKVHSRRRLERAVANGDGGNWKELGKTVFEGGKHKLQVERDWNFKDRDRGDTEEMAKEFTDYDC
jgi:hypothetical protein